MPTELDELNRRKMQMEIEEAALKKEDDRISKERLEDLQKELAEVKEEFNNRMAQWENEKPLWRSCQNSVRRSNPLTARSRLPKERVITKRQENSATGSCLH